MLNRDPKAQPSLFDFTFNDSELYHVGRFNPLHYSVVNGIQCYLTTILVTFNGGVQFYRINWKKFTLLRKPNNSFYHVFDFLQFFYPVGPIVLPPFHRWQTIFNEKGWPRIWAASFCPKTIVKQ